MTARIGPSSIDLGRVGFRRLERRDPSAGFGIAVNDVPIFCRGAIWTGLDPTGLPANPVALSAALRRAQQAGMNMLRITGMTVYETSLFFELCDELGIMVWHDFMFARFDYPDQADFLASVRTEARAFLDLAQAHPCLTVLCGGSELVQAAIMSGCPPETWHMPLFEQLLAEEAAAARPDVPYLPHSPWTAKERDVLPIAPAASVAHYFGVGAYERPLQDLAAADVRFAAECLAFANLPEPETYRHLATASASGCPAVRDLGAEWNFADVRDHYTQSLFNVSIPTLRRQDSEALLDLGRTTVALIMQQAMSAWRSDGRCGGALVLMFQDLVQGAGWGVVDSEGRPKSGWYGLRSVCQPVQVLLRDLGQNGIVLHAVNETATARAVRLSLRGLSPDGMVEQLGTAAFRLEARENRAMAAATLLGRWRDLANAWQFGTPAFTVLGATLDDVATGERLSDTTHFPAGPALPRGQPQLTAALNTDPAAPAVTVSARGFAQFVQVDDVSCIPADNYFHLWPGEARIVPLHRSCLGGSPAGTVRALNAHGPAHYGVAA